MDILMRYRYITIQRDTYHWKFKFVKSLSIIFPGQPLQFSYCKAIYGSNKSKNKLSLLLVCFSSFLKMADKMANKHVRTSIYHLPAVHSCAPTRHMFRSVCLFLWWRCSRTPAVLQDTLVLGLLHSEAGYQSLLNILGTGVDTVDRLVSLGR